MSHPLESDSVRAGHAVDETEKEYAAHDDDGFVAENDGDNSESVSSSSNRSSSSSTPLSADQLPVLAGKGLWRECSTLAEQLLRQKVNLDENQNEFIELIGWRAHSASQLRAWPSVVAILHEIPNFETNEKIPFCLRLLKAVAETEISVHVAQAKLGPGQNVSPFHGQQLTALTALRHWIREQQHALDPELRNSWEAELLAVTVGALGRTGDYCSALHLLGDLRSLLPPDQQPHVVRAAGRLRLLLGDVSGATKCFELAAAATSGSASSQEQQQGQTDQALLSVCRADFHEAAALYRNEQPREPLTAAAAAPLPVVPDNPLLDPADKTRLVVDSAAAAAADDAAELVLDGSATTTTTADEQPVNLTPDELRSNRQANALVCQIYDKRGHRAVDQLEQLALSDPMTFLTTVTARNLYSLFDLFADEPAARKQELHAVALAKANQNVNSTVIGRN